MALHETEVMFGKTMVRRARGDYGQDQTLATFPPVAPAPQAGDATAPLPFAELVDRWATEPAPSLAALRSPWPQRRLAASSWVVIVAAVRRLHPMPALGATP